jgi:hypothetical protein
MPAVTSVTPWDAPLRLATAHGLVGEGRAVRVGQLDVIGVRLSNEAGDSGGKFFMLRGQGILVLPKSLSFVSWQD